MFFSRGLFCIRPVLTTPENRYFKTQHSVVILDLFFFLGGGGGGKTRAGKSHQCHPFPKALAVFELLSVHTKMQIWRFQIPPVGRTFSKSSVFVTV